MEGCGAWEQGFETELCAQQQPACRGTFPGKHIHRAELDGATHERGVRRVGYGVCVYVLFLGFHRVTCVSKALDIVKPALLRGRFLLTCVL